VAAVARDPNGDASDMLLILLAPGSAEPDVFKWRLDNPQSIREAVRRLDEVPPLLRSSIGLFPIDVADIDGAVVAAVEAGGSAEAAGIRSGDTIVGAGGAPVTSARQLLSAISLRQAGQPLSLDVRDLAGTARKVDVKPESVPNVLSLADQGLPSNKLAVEYGYRIGNLNNALDETAVRLNLAAVSMRLKNWTDAQRELERVVKIVTDGGVPAPVGDAIGGTAQYLLGISAEAVGDTATAERAWKLAAQARGNLLTENGESLKDLSEQRLNQMFASTTGGRR
jgi:membrane-associated protease RseP (regulator of RpoE activity)